MPKFNDQFTHCFLQYSLKRVGTSFRERCLSFLLIFVD